MQKDILAEGEAYSRIEVARAARRFPVIFDMLATGSSRSVARLEKLRLAKDMLGHAIPSGDDAAILDRALTTLLVDLARGGRILGSAEGTAPGLFERSQSGVQLVPEQVELSVNHSTLASDRAAASARLPSVPASSSVPMAERSRPTETRCRTFRCDR